MEAAKVFKRFSSLSAGFWVGLALLLGAGITYYAERRMLELATTATLSYFQHLPRFMVTSEDFVRLKEGEKYDRFDRLIKARFLTPPIFCVKIYDTDGRLVYHAPDRTSIGRTFSHDQQLRKALQGEVALNLKRLEGGEHAFEGKGSPQVLEIHVPVLLEGTDRVIGAFEIYSPLDPLYRGIWKMRAVVWSSVVFGLFLLYAALSWTFRRASRTILTQNEALAVRAEDLKKAYEELKAAEEQLVRSERLASAGRLAAGIVHEIGNPLASVLGMVDLLLRCRGTPQEKKECRENLERLASEIIRLKGILQGLLDYTRPASKEVKPLPINGVVERTMLLLSSQKMFRGIQLIQRLQEPSPFALADERLLQQVIMNVLMNAAQAMPQGGRINIITEIGPVKEQPEGTIAVGRPFGPDGEAATIAIADTGPGIPQEDLPRIFEPFFSTKETGKGVGLGLAICHSLIEAMKGAIVVESHPGLGTTFYILLPLAEGAPFYDG